MYAPNKLSERVGDIIIYKNCFSYSNLQMGETEKPMRFWLFAM